MMDYQQKLDEIFANGHSWNHRTLRTVFDPYSSEYNSTSMEEKVHYVQKWIMSDLSLPELIQGYKEFYRESNKPHVINSLEDGLAQLIKAMIVIDNQ